MFLVTRETLFSFSDLILQQQHERSPLSPDERKKDSGAGESVDNCTGEEWGGGGFQEQINIEPDINDNSNNVIFRSLFPGTTTWSE